MIDSNHRRPAGRFNSALLSSEPLLWVVLSAVLFLPYWSASVLPHHDSLFKYQVFHFAYSQMVTSGEIPMWVPYGSYGISAGFHLLVTLTPADYLVGALGIVLSANDTLVLFKTSIFLEIAIYAIGLFLLARSVYESPTSRFVVVLGGLCSLSWPVQLQLNFHVFYLFPYVLLFLFEFFRTGNPGSLWIAAAIEVVSLIGSVPYFAPLHLFVLVVMCCVAFAAGARPRFERSPKRWLFRWEAGVALALAALFLFTAWLGMQEVVTIADGRDPNSYRVPLHTFLEYGRMTKATIVYGYLSGAVTHADNTYYIGLLPLALVLLGLFRLAHPLFLGVAAAALALVWMSFGGGFSTIVYYFPTMSFFRHISLTFGATSFLLLIASGWVVDDLLKSRASSPGKPEPAVLPPSQRPIVLIVLVLMFIDFAGSWRQYDRNLAANHYAPLLFLVLPRALAYIAALVAVRSRLSGLARANARAGRVWAPLVAAYALDIGSYQTSVLVTLPRTHTAIPTGAFAPEPLPYWATRTEEDFLSVDLGWKAALLEKRSTHNNAVYAFSYTFVGVDPCYPKVRNDLWQRDVLAALIARGSRPRQWPQDDFLPKNDRTIGAILGCGAPKISMVSEHVRAESREQALDLFKSASDPSSRPVLETAEGHDRGRPASGKIGEAHIISFSANRIEIDVRNELGRPIWMYYADAFHPGWQARVDGASGAVVRANVGFKAVEIPPGRHTVILTFGHGARQVVFSLYAVTGAALCFIGLVLGLGAALRKRTS